MPNGTLKSSLDGAKPFVAGYLNDRLLDIAPDFVDTIVQVGNDFGDMAKQLRPQRDARRHGSGQRLHLGRHRGRRALQDRQRRERPRVRRLPDREHQSRTNVGVTLDATGKLLDRRPQDAGVVRQGPPHRPRRRRSSRSVDPNATNLQQLLADKVDCAAVGQAINDALVQQFGFGGGAGTWTSACTAGLTLRRADHLRQDRRHRRLGSRVRPDRRTAKGVDTNHDSKVGHASRPVSGRGTLSYGGYPRPARRRDLHRHADVATQFGERVVSPRVEDGWPAPGMVPRPVSSACESRPKWFGPTVRRSDC